MLSTMKATLAAFVIGVGMLGAGCESSSSADGAKHDHSAMAATGSGQAMTCEKCKVTWVKAPVANDKGRIVAYKSVKSHECPDCRAAVTNFFASGKMEHSCATCGENALQKCEAHVQK